MLRNQLVRVLFKHCERFFLIERLQRVEHIHQHGKAHVFVDTDRFELRLGELREIRLDVDHLVGDDLHGHIHTFDRHIGDLDAGLLDFEGAVLGDELALFRQNLARAFVNDGHGKAETADTVGDGELFVILVAANTGQIVAVIVEEQTFQMGLGARQCWRFARTQLFIHFDQRFFRILRAVFFQRRFNTVVLAEEFADVVVGGETEGADKGGDGDLAVFVDADKEQVVLIRFILEPRAAVRDDGGGKQLFAGHVVGHTEIDARGTDKLGDDDALRAVDDEGAGIGHEREVAHIDFAFLDFAGLFVIQTGGDTHRRRIGHHALLAFAHAVFGFFLHPVVDEGEHKVAGVVGDIGHIAQHLFETHIQEPLIGILLHLDQVGHLHHFADFTEAFSGDACAELRFCYMNHPLITPIFRFTRADRHPRGNLKKGLDFFAHP